MNLFICQIRLGTLKQEIKEEILKEMIGILTLELQFLLKLTITIANVIMNKYKFKSDN